MRPILTYYQQITENSIPLSKDGRDYICDAVIISASPILLDDTKLVPDANGTYLTTNNEIFWGVGAEAMHPLFVGQTTQLIPITKLSDIVIKSNAPAIGQIIVFTIFKESKGEQLI